MNTQLIQLWVCFFLNVMHFVTPTWKFYCCFVLVFVTPHFQCNRNDSVSKLLTTLTEIIYSDSGKVTTKYDINKLRCGKVINNFNLYF